MPPAPDRYRILGELGRGGMGVVYHALDTVLHREVAIKSLLPAPGVSPKEADLQRRQLLRDAQAAAQLAHPNIVTVYDVTEHEGAARIVMEFVPGGSLDKQLVPGESQPRAITLRLLWEVASALDYVHSRNILHRDVKPGNVLLHPSGSAKVMDFGISRMAGGATVTPTGHFMGSLDFISLEQLQNGPLDGRCDQYSLAAMAYLLMTGSTLFGPLHLAPMMYKIALEMPQPASTRNAALPSSVDEVLARALRKLSAERFDSCTEFVEALAQAWSETSPDEARHPDEPVRIAAPAPTVFSPSRQPPGPAQPQTWTDAGGLRYVLIPAGTFWMGCSEEDTECWDNERPQHEVTISRPFWMTVTPVTVAAYKRFAQATGRAMPTEPSFNAGWRDEQQPMVNIDCDAAGAYCAWAGGRLPTEAEWEYAARGGVPGARYGALEEIAWHDGNSGGRAHRVGQKKANAYGLHDMLGSVWEWVEDRYGPYAAHTATDPTGPASGGARVARGGSWKHIPRNARASNRFRSGLADWSNYLGVRCVREQEIT